MTQQEFAYHQNNCLIADLLLCMQAFLMKERDKKLKNVIVIFSVVPYFAETA